MSISVGIMTFHYVNNHGAVLQTYALRKMINSFQGCHAEIINYVPEGYVYPVPPGSTFTEMQCKRKKFNRFLIDHCGVHSSMIHTVVGNSYDIYLVGSDMIWNTDFKNVVASYEYFFPNLDDTAKRIAYSASIGIAQDRIDTALFQKYLSKFNFISLREKSYVKMISELSGLECKHTLDPTLLLKGSDYETLIETPSQLKSSDATCKPFVLCFWYDRGDGGFVGVETSNALARKYEFVVRHTFLENSSTTRQLLVRDEGCMLQTGIGEFLWYIKNAQVVVTNSFHGAIFSILFKKPLYICYQEPWNCRLENLVELLGLEDRVVSGYLAPDKFSLEMDFVPIFKALEKERENSIRFLKNSIGGV